MSAPHDDSLIEYARRKYFFALFGLIPFFGLVLGPISLGLGLYTVVRGRLNKNSVSAKLGWVISGVGLLTTVTNWLGVMCIVRGLSGS